MNYFRVLTLGLTSYLLLFWFSGPAGIVLLPLIVALVIALATREFVDDDSFWPTLFSSATSHKQGKTKKRKRRTRPEVVVSTANRIFAVKTAWLGGLTGFVGSLVATVALTPAHFGAYVQQASPILNRDIIGSLYRTLYEAIVSNAAARPTWPVFILLTTALTAAFSSGLGFLGPKYRRYVPWAVVALTCLIMVTTVLQSTGGFRQAIAQEPPDFQYAFDGVVYLKTFYVMSDQGFYPALVEANAKDSRPAARVRDGKLYGLIYSPFWFRTPTIFYLWRILTFGNAVGILYLGMFASSGIILLSYLAGKSLVGESGAFLSLAIMPYLVIGLIWYNLFYPDWWAGMALTAGILFWIREQYWPGAAAFLSAAAFREVVFVFLLIFLVVALVHRKTARLPFATATGLFLLIYPFHFFHAKQFIGLTGQEVSSIVSHLSPEKFISTASYMMFPYGYFLWPVFLLMAVAILVWVWKQRYDMLALSVLSFPYLAYSSSTYWGQQLLPFIIFSAFLVFLLKVNDFALKDQ